MTDVTIVYAIAITAWVIPPGISVLPRFSWILLNIFLLIPQMFEFIDVQKMGKISFKQVSLLFCINIILYRYLQHNQY